MPIETKFAAITRRGVEKPFAFSSSGELARWLLRRRAGNALVLKDATIKVRQDEHPREVVAVYAENQISESTHFIAYAWLDGAGRRVLEAALRSAEPPALSGCAA